MDPRMKTRVRTMCQLALCGLAALTLLIGCEKPTEEYEATKLVNVSIATVQATPEVADTIEQPGVAMPKARAKAPAAEEEPPLPTEEPGMPVEDDDLPF